MERQRPAKHKSRKARDKSGTEPTHHKRGPDNANIQSNNRQQGTRRRDSARTIRGKGGEQREPPGSPYHPNGHRNVHDGTGKGLSPACKADTSEGACQPAASKDRGILTPEATTLNNMQAQSDPNVHLETGQTQGQRCLSHGYRHDGQARSSPKHRIGNQQRDPNLTPQHQRRQRGTECTSALSAGGWAAEHWQEPKRRGATTGTEDRKTKEGAQAHQTRMTSFPPVEAPRLAPTDGMSTVGNSHTEQGPQAKRNRDTQHRPNSAREGTQAEVRRCWRQCCGKKQASPQKHRRRSPLRGSQCQEHAGEDLATPLSTGPEAGRQEDPVWKEAITRSPQATAERRWRGQGQEGRTQKTMRDTAKRYSLQEPASARPESTVPTLARQHPCHEQEVRQAPCLQLSPHASQLARRRGKLTGTGPASNHWRAQQHDDSSPEEEPQQDWKWPKRQEGTSMPEKRQQLSRKCAASTPAQKQKTDKSLASCSLSTASSPPTSRETCNAKPRYIEQRPAQRPHRSICCLDYVIYSSNLPESPTDQKEASP
ncbi:hypothetical protein NDU88_002352 [Pleurodeles waltl]|uniref:Uncharacterized protein n=1 Tax=Pleurodeles waltl TaxID=8319 RepID=A0AAV7P6P3_PLEWA|nr:hypothetical protein NDU88_002352 [Pleurodeles waltl]